MEQKLTDAQRMKALREKRKAEDWFVLELKIAFPPTSRFAKYAKLAGGVGVIKKELKRKFEKIDHQLTLMEIADAELSNVLQKSAGCEGFKKLGVDYLLDCLSFGYLNGPAHVYDSLEDKQRNLVKEKFPTPFKFSARIDSIYERLKQKEESS